MNIEFKTRNDMVEALLSMMEGVKPYYTDDYAHIFKGTSGVLYDDNTIGIEGFSRVLWGLGPLWSSGDDETLLENTLKGLKNGSDPANEAYWGELNDSHQAFVEMAAIAVAILLNPDKIWKKLDDATKKNLNLWLLQINKYDMPHNNWLFFRVLVNVAMKKVGADYSKAAIEGTLEEIESFYLGDGWYSDGATLQRDYYISFAMHYYSLIYYSFMKNEDEERCKRIEERAKLFANDFIYWFTDSGEAICYGRSLTYRFAQCAFFSALAFAKVEAIPYGEMKGIILRNLRCWFRKPIFDEKGFLTIGYGYPNLIISEGYNSPTSPYWALKSFLVLALSENEEFWLSDEKPMPKLDNLHACKHAFMLIHRVNSNNVVAYTGGQFPGFMPVHYSEKYEKFAYSSYFGFQVPRSYARLNQASCDNMLAFEKDGLIFVRRKCDDVKVEADRHISVWSPFKGVTVTTEIIPKGNGHVRRHTIVSDGEYKFYECGFAIPIDNYLKTSKEYIKCGIRLADENSYSLIRCDSENAMAKEVLCEANTNLMYRKTVMPYLEGKTNIGVMNLCSYIEADLVE